MLLVESDPDAYDRFYNVIANPILWFIQHYLWDLSNAPDIRQEEADAWDEGYVAVNRDLAEAVIRTIEGEEDPLVMLHDYHLYTAPALIREARPDVFLQHFVHIPWTQADSWRVLPQRIREEIYRGMLANDIIGFHTQRLLPELPPLLPAPDGARGRLRPDGGHPRGRRDLGTRLPARDRRRAPRPRGRVRRGRRSTRRSYCAAAATT